MLESLFNKVAGLQACNFIKKDSNTGFPVTTASFLRAAFFKEHLRRLLLQFAIADVYRKSHF